MLIVIHSHVEDNDVKSFVRFYIVCEKNVKLKRKKGTDENISSGWYPQLQSCTCNRFSGKKSRHFILAKHSAQAYAHLHAFPSTV